MVSKRKNYPFSGGTFNSLAKFDNKFHWSKAYSWYLDFPEDDNILTILGWVV